MQYQTVSRHGLRLMNFLFTFFICLQCSAQIRVSDNKRFLATEDGQPFFWLGDTQWQLFYRLSREEVLHVLDTRKQQGFNVIHATILAEHDGLRSPNYYGDLPLSDLDPEKLAVTAGSDTADDEAYDFWDHIAFVIDAAAQRGMYIGLLPTWGDKVAEGRGIGPVVFNEHNAAVYGKLIAVRFSTFRNIVWIVGGDRHPVYTIKKNGVLENRDDRPIWRAMALGIRSVNGGSMLMTYHPSSGERSTSAYLQNESWMDMNTFQSGHGERGTDAWNWVLRDLALKPLKPVLDMESCYEDHPINPWDGKWTRERGYFNPYDIRRRVYREIFAGACGVTYGHHQVWQFVNDGKYRSVNLGDTIIGWQKALYAEGAGQMKFLGRLMLSRPYFSRVFDAGMITSRKHSSFENLVMACRDEAGSYAMLYFPRRCPVEISLRKMSAGKKITWWFDPRTGRVTRGRRIGKNTKIVTMEPPQGFEDAVLIIDDRSSRYALPATF